MTQSASSASRPNPFGARGPLGQGYENTTIYRLSALAGQSGVALDRLPVTVRILLENLLRTADLAPHLVSNDDILTLASWTPNKRGAEFEFPFMPARVLLQDFTGVPAVVDLAAMRDAIKELGGDPDGVNPLVPADLVIDHSVQVDAFGTVLSFATNVQREYERNAERYMLLRWAQGAFRNFSVVPPGTGIVHQVNLEYLGKVVMTSKGPGGETLAYPDTLVGTDSHTTMINGLGVLGWGVGGIEAEAVMLGQPLYQLTPEVVGMRLTGALPEGATATDLVLAVTQMLRKHGVVGRFVEFCGAGLSALSVADRATISNMSPEYGATAALFPVDDATLRYLRDTGRDAALVNLVERYSKEQGIFRTDDTPDPQFNSLLELDLATIEPSLAGPRRPQDRVALSAVRENFRTSFQEQIMGTGPDANGKSIGRFENEGGNASPDEPEGRNWHPHTANISIQDEEVEIGDGSVVIAAITSCTNTSNPSVMIGAGLLAKHAVERGLKTRPHVKTSLAPGSRVVTEYLNTAELTSDLDALGFDTVGYGCTTCIGSSGPLPEPEAGWVRGPVLVAGQVVSGRRVSEGRIHPQVRASYLASPPLVVAYSLAGTPDLDLANEPLGEDPNGQPVYLRDIWPSQQEVQETMARVVKPEVFTKEYARVFDGDDRWRALPVPEGGLFAWDEASTYVRRPPFFEGMSLEPQPLGAIRGARVLVSVGDSVTTDHISPAGSFSADSPAGQYLREHGVSVRDFNSYGSRRGN